MGLKIYDVCKDSYKQRRGIEGMFKNCKTGGDNESRFSRITGEISTFSWADWHPDDHSLVTRVKNKYFEEISLYWSAKGSREN